MDPRLDEARRHLAQARYDSALVVLHELAEEAPDGSVLRQETFRLLGLVYTVTNQPGAAKDAIRTWIDASPPSTAPDPDKDVLAFVRLYYEVRKEMNEGRYCGPDLRPPDPCQFVTAPPDPGIQTLAVVPFGNNAIDDHERLAPLSDGLADVMIRQLSGTAGLRIVEREWLEWLMRELDISQTDVIDDRTALRLGHLLGAHAVLLGDFLYLNDVLTLGARLVKVETGEVLVVDSQGGPLEEFGELSGKLSAALARAMDRKIQRGEWEGRTPTNDLGALLAYAEGLALYDNGAHAAAAEKFSRALDFDPSYILARQRYDALQPLLASQDN